MLRSSLRISGDLLEGYLLKERKFLYEMGGPVSKVGANRT